MTTKVEKQAGESPEFPTKRIQCAILVTQVVNTKGKKATKTQEEVKASKRITGLFKMSTFPGFDFWFSFSTLFGMPTLGALEKNEKIHSGVKRAARSRIKAAIKNLGKKADGKKLPTDKWLMVTVEEENFYGG